MLVLCFSVTPLFFPFLLSPSFSPKSSPTYVKGSLLAGLTFVFLDLPASFPLFSCLESPTCFFDTVSSFLLLPPPIPHPHHVVSCTPRHSLGDDERQRRGAAFSTRSRPQQPRRQFGSRYSHRVPAIPSQQASRPCCQRSAATTVAAADALGHPRHSWDPASSALRGRSRLHCRDL